MMLQFGQKTNRIQTQKWFKYSKELIFKNLFIL